MSDTEKVVEETTNFLGIDPKVEEDEEEVEHESVRLTDAPEDAELPEEEVEEGEEEATEEVEAKEQPKQEESKLDAVMDRLSRPKDDDERERLRREIDELKSRQAKYEGELEGQSRFLDKVIGGEEKEADPVEDFQSPAVAELLRRARETDDPQEEMRLMVKVADTIAEHKAESKTKELRERLDKLDETAVVREDTTYREQQMAAALHYLEQVGGTSAELVKELRNKGKDSHLMRTWLATPGITRDHRSMILEGIGLAALVDNAAASGNGEPTPEATTVDATEGPRPKASKRSDELTKPQTPDEEKLRSTVVANLKSSLRGGRGGGNLLDF